MSGGIRNIKSLEQRKLRLTEVFGDYYTDKSLTFKLEEEENAINANAFSKELLFYPIVKVVRINQRNLPCGNNAIS